MSEALTDNPAEAIIISGPRKGEFIRVDSHKWTLTNEEQAQLDALVLDAQRLAEEAHRTRVDMEEFVRELRRSRMNRNGLA